MPELDTGFGLAAVLAAVAYLVSVRISRRGWPWRRTVAWLAGLLAVVAATVGPLAEAAEHSFPTHVAAHLLLAMAAPLLLVLAAPVTLALRTLPVTAARRLSRVLRTRLVRVLSEPAVAAVLDIGGMWVYYRSGVWTAAQHHAVLHLLSHTHMVAAGTLFTLALVGVDPMPHRRGYAHRAAVLVAAAAAHAVLAKTLYLAAPVGVSTAAGQLGAMIMYYGGDVVELALLIVLGSRWYRSRLRLSSRARTPSASRTLGRPHGRSAL